MAFDIKSAVPIQDEDEDGLNQVAGRFDPSTAVPISDAPGPMTPAAPALDQAKAQPWRFNWQMLGKEALAQAQDVLTMPSRLLGLPHPPMVSGLATQGIPALFRKAQEPVGTFTIPSISMQDIKNLAAGHLTHTESDIQPTPIDIGIGALIAAQAAGGIRYGMAAQEYNAYVKKSLDSANIKAAIKQNIGTFDQALSEAGIKLPANMPVDDRVNVVLNEAKGSQTLGDVVGKLVKGEIKPRPAPAGEVIDVGAAEAPQAGETVHFTNPAGVMKSGVIQEVTPNHAIIEMEGKTVVAPLAQLVPPPAKEPWEMTRQEYAAAQEKPVPIPQENIDILNKIKSDISGAQPGKKYVTKDEQGNVVSAGYEPSDYSYIPYWPEGWGKDKVNTVIDKVLANKNLTVKQQDTLDTLLTMYKESANDQAKLEQELAAEGVNQSEIDAAKRGGEEEAHGDFKNDESNVTPSGQIRPEMQAPAPAKEAWEMTLQEYVASKISKIYDGIPFNKIKYAKKIDKDEGILTAAISASGKIYTGQTHAIAIEKAINSGDAVWNERAYKYTSPDGQRLVGDSLFITDSGKIVDRATASEGRSLFAGGEFVSGNKKTFTPENGIKSQLTAEWQAAQKAVQQPAAGGLTRREIPEQMKKWMEKGVTITERQNPIKIIDDEAQIKDISGKVVDLPKGHEMTPYKLSNGKIWLHDGKDVIVESGQLQNLANKNVVLGKGQYDMPEGVEEVVKGGNDENTKIAKDEFDAYSEQLAKKYNLNPLQNLAMYKTMKGMSEAEVSQYEELQHRWLATQNQTKFSQWQLPGGENYREVLIKAPENVGSFADFIKSKGITSSDSISGQTKKQQSLMDEYDALKKEQNSNSFKSSHWDEPNVLAHVRMNDRTTPDGKKVLFIEEIQSDWAREARKGTGVPQNENLKNWQSLVLKRILKEAVDGGYDAIAWTTGEQQAARYDLSKQVDEIKWFYEGKDKPKSVWLTPNKGSLIRFSVNKDGLISKDPTSSFEPPEMFVGKNISDVIGKGLAEKIMQENQGELKGAGLKFGGEWAKSLYDRQIPNLLKDLTKGKVEDIEIAVSQEQDIMNGEDGGSEIILQPSIAITPELKARVLGQPAAGGATPQDEHYKIVKQALEAGKNVPEEVLADYPDLAKMKAERENSPTGKLATKFTKGLEAGKVEDKEPSVGANMSSESGSLDVSKIPGAQRLADMTQEAVHLISPKTGVDPRALDKLFEMKGGRDKVEFELERQMKQFEDMFDRMPQDKQIDFVDRIKRGQEQETPELQAVADMMRKIEDAYFAEVQKIKPAASYLENHFRVLWKERPGKAGEAEAQRGFNGLYRRPLQGTKGFLKRHVFEDMSEGLALGYKPYSYNPMTMWRNAVMDMQKLITANRMFQSLKNMGMIQFVKFGGKAPEGFVKIDDAIGKVYFPLKEGMVNAGDYYIEEGAGRLLNNYLGKDAIRASAIGHTLLQFKNITTSIELSLSPFHAAYESGAAVATKFGLGTQKVFNSFDLIGGLTDLVSAGTAPADYAVTGGRAIAYVTDPEAFIKTSAGESFLKEFPDAQAMIHDLFMGGGKLAMHQDYKLNTLKALKEGIKNREPWAIAMHAIPGANEVIMKPLFEVYIPRLKIGAFLKDYAQALRQSKGQLESGEITRTTLARNTWASIEQRFGEMNFDNLFWNRNLKTGLQILVRSITWKVGALKNLAYTFPEQMAEFGKAAQNRRMPQLKSNTGYLLGVAVLVAAASAIIQKLNINEWPKDLKDYMAPRFNKMGDRIMINTHLKDWVHIIHSPSGFLTSSLTGEWGRMIDVMKNKDFFGTEIRHPDDPLTKQAWDSMKYLFPTPFSISNFQRLSQLDAPLGIKATNVLGITQPTPKYISNSPAQNLASEIMREKLPVGARTQKQADASQARYKLMDQYRRTGDDTAIQQAVEEGTITRKQAHEIIKESGMSDLARTIHGFSFDDAVKVYEKASPQERADLDAVMQKKYHNAMHNAATHEERVRIKDVYNKLTATTPDDGGIGKAVSDFVLPEAGAAEVPQADFAPIYKETLKHEGGINAKYKEGLTNQGVVQSTYDLYRSRIGKGKQSVALMTSAERNDLYKHEFFDKPGYGQLPQNTAGVMFDYGVQSGPSRATRALQKVVNVPADGKLGTQTINAVNEYISKNGESALVNAVLDYRSTFLEAQKRSAAIKSGWRNRIKKLRELYA